MKYSIQWKVLLTGWILWRFIIPVNTPEVYKRYETLQTFGDQGSKANCDSRMKETVKELGSGYKHGIYEPVPGLQYKLSFHCVYDGVEPEHVVKYERQQRGI